jgi:squalene synthase HpnC
MRLGSKPLDDVAQPRNVSAWAGLPAHYAIPETPPTLADAHAYCARIARGNYENFSVATWFLPKRLHQHFFNVYAYCRVSDDLGDEVGNAEQSLKLLNAWEAELDACYRGSPRHPVFVALAQTVRQFEIPQYEFAALLKAFRDDQAIVRYESFDDLLGYCRYSANPVGHLVLYLGGYRDAERQQLSDYTCTALQLANFWQDVAVDFAKGRIYLPLQDMLRFGVGEADIAARRVSPGFRDLMRFEVARAHEWFQRGLPLARKVDRELRVDIELFSRGGQEILNAIERRHYDVLTARPVVSRSRKLWLVARAAMGKLL